MNRCLLILNLADNQIGDVGGIKLAEVIYFNLLFCILIKVYDNSFLNGSFFAVHY